jgi:hypothetical protein
MADENTPDQIAEHLEYAHANGCAAAFQETAGTTELQPALVKIIGPQPVCVSFTTFAGQGNAVVTEEDWEWLVTHGGKPGGARADGVLQAGETEKKIAVTLAPRPDAAERTLTIGGVVLRLPEGEWDHLLANPDVYAADE